MARAAVPHMAGGFDYHDRFRYWISRQQILLDYSMTKGGIHAFFRSLARHLTVEGIRVIAVSPGPVWTPLNPSDKPAKNYGFGADTPMKRPRNRKKLRRPSSSLPPRVAQGAITGEILPIVGGYT